MSPRLVCAMIVLIASSACSRHPTPRIPESEPRSAMDGAPSATGAVRATPRRAARCASETGTLPAAQADIDGDGGMERPSVSWTDEGFVVGVHAVPGFEVERTFRVVADHVQTAVTRRLGGTEGRLWVYTGRVVDVASNGWVFTLERLEGDRLVAVWRGTSSAHPNLSIDLDGDGAADPILAGDSGLQAYVGGTLVEVALQATPSSISGLPGPHGIEQAVDLDGDGDLDVVADAPDGLHFVEARGLRSVRLLPASGTLSGLTVWGGAPVVFSNMDVLASPVERVFAADAANRMLLEVRRTDRLCHVAPGVDPAGDGSLLALNCGDTTGLVEAGQRDAGESLEMTLALSADPREPRAHPARFSGGAGHELAGIRQTRVGSPAMGGNEDSEYEVRLASRPTRGAVRTIRVARTPGEGWPSLRVLDLEHDGQSELLIEEQGAYANGGIEAAGGGSSTWILMAGDGTILWQDQTRYFDFETARQRDERARAAAVELSPDGMLGLRFRTPGEEWWVLPAGFEGDVPPCLE